MKGVSPPSSRVGGFAAGGLAVILVLLLTVAFAITNVRGGFLGGSGPIDYTLLLAAGVVAAVAIVLALVVRGFLAGMLIVAVAIPSIAIVFLAHAG